MCVFRCMTLAYLLFEISFWCLQIQKKNSNVFFLSCWRKNCLKKYFLLSFLFFFISFFLSIKNKKYTFANWSIKSNVMWCYFFLQSFSLLIFEKKRYFELIMNEWMIKDKLISSKDNISFIGILNSIFFLFRYFF